MNLTLRSLLSCEICLKKFQKWASAIIATIVRSGSPDTWINLPRLYPPRFYLPRFNPGRFYPPRLYPPRFYPGRLIYLDKI